ncbi:hypothetical protein AKJ61_00885 [candidate division MSBL1 archaeon SCGC-AAA259B11]|uniref:Uncharacterized protein n=1 Tax=candidate division MSBL1 archaeon SCGC-AAA259B11 TaxID=1698260 RepID=A0A133U8C1_9EURY|nr:hypothetical protein AKJ61_00885 [candidate division MSBL1 archaeon SCGC-AAA259B11]
MNEKDLEKIGREWGRLELVFYPHFEESRRWILRNQTDEGLGPEPRKEFEGASPEEVIEKAKKGLEK